jgi:hypothetical protein
MGTVIGKKAVTWKKLGILSQWNWFQIYYQKAYEYTQNQGRGKRTAHSIEIYNSQGFK